METLTNKEQLIMKCIWDSKEPPTLYDVNGALKSKYDTEYTRSTTRTYLTHLEKKGYITLERKGTFSYIIPLITEQEFCRQQMEHMKNFWFDGSTKDMVASLAEVIRNEEGKIEDLIDEFDD